MRTGDSLRKLVETVDLLSMLEQLTDSLSRNPINATDVAWGGIKLTLRQSKKNIIRAYEAFSEESLTEQRTEGDEILRVPQNAAFSSLAGRVQKAPTTTGTIRELRSSPANGDLATARDPQKRGLNDPRGSRRVES